MVITFLLGNRGKKCLFTTEESNVFLPTNVKVCKHKHDKPLRRRIRSKVQQFLNFGGLGGK